MKPISIACFLEYGALTWPNGFDLDSINLNMEMRKAGELTRVPAAAFDWRITLR